MNTTAALIAFSLSTAAIFFVLWRRASRRISSQFEQNGLSATFAIMTYSTRNKSQSGTSLKQLVEKVSDKVAAQKKTELGRGTISVLE